MCAASPSVAEEEFQFPSTLAECAVIFEAWADAADRVRQEMELTLEAPVLNAVAEKLRDEARAAAGKIGAPVAVERVERTLEVLPDHWAARLADPLLFNANYGWFYHCNMIAYHRGMLPNE